MNGFLAQSPNYLKRCWFRGSVHNNFVRNLMVAGKGLFFNSLGSSSNFHSQL